MPKPIEAILPIGEGHSGGDFALFSTILDGLAGNGGARATARQALAGHLVACADDITRLTCRVLEPETSA